MKMIGVLQRSHFEPRRRNIAQADESKCLTKFFAHFFAGKNAVFARKISRCYVR